MSELTMSEIAAMASAMELPATELPTMDMDIALEDVAEFAPRSMFPLRALPRLGSVCVSLELICRTHPSDWHIEGGNARLSEAGVERITQVINQSL